ncbi:MAG: hypothetical protein ACXVAE_02930 [Candidatus Limnocylindrales bacterium]
MIPLLVAIVGASLALAALAILRSFGARYRVGRLLVAAPSLSIAEALELARTGPPRYVHIRGRVSSQDVFPDEQDRPLVYRRRRLELAHDGGWRILREEREAVPFGLEDRADFIALDADALAEGLVVLSREATGRAADIPDGLPAGTAPNTPARQRIDQVSAVEHADAAGVPALDPEGRPVLTAGLGRPLILTTLERGEAMRVLAADGRGRLRAAAILLVLGCGLLLAALVGAVATALGLLAANPAWWL